MTLPEPCCGDLLGRARVPDRLGEDIEPRGAMESEGGFGEIICFTLLLD